MVINEINHFKRFVYTGCETPKAVGRNEPLVRALIIIIFEDYRLFLHAKGKYSVTIDLCNHLKLCASSPIE
jgi:hypothetical protein